MKRSRRDVIFATGSIVATGLAGCSSDGGSDAAPPANGSATNTDHHGGSDHHGTETGHHEVPASPQSSVEVGMGAMADGNHFDPHLAWVEPGGTVTFKLESGSHSTTAYASANDKPDRIPDEASGWDSGVLSEQGTTFEQTFEVPGVYDYFCLPHEGGGMVGTVLVGEPDPHGQAGLAAPQSDLPSGAQQKIEELNEKVEKALGHHESE